MRNKILFSLVILGVIAGIVSAYVYAMPKKALPPVFSPSPNPYAEGIYANGIIESYQAQGANISIYPEVPGTITQILVHEGQHVEKGAPLIQLDDSVQRATSEQQKSQAEAARAMLDELKAQPRKETLVVSQAQVEMARASMKSAQDELDKQQRAFQIEPRAVSKDTLDNAVNAAKVAKANLDVVTRQYELTKAGAWSFDIKTQERQFDAMSKAATASDALLAKYAIKAPAAGSVLSIEAAVGSYVSPQGAYDTYTQGFAPIIVMGSANDYLGVRCYIDEILIPKLPPTDSMHATMFIRGTSVSVPLEFVRVQPYVSPKIELSNQRLEKVDLRVLPIIFRFAPPAGVNLYPGELVDVYVSQK